MIDYLTVHTDVLRALSPIWSTKPRALICVFAALYCRRYLSVPTRQTLHPIKRPYRSRHILHDRQSGQPGVVCVEVSSRIPRRACPTTARGPNGERLPARRSNPDRAPSTLSKDRNASAVFSFALLVLSHFRARAGRRPRHLKRSSRLRLTCRAGRSKRR
jgi:hypothetical protein